MMKKFQNELFAIQLDPPKGKDGKSVTYAAYEDGTILVSTAAAFSMDEAFTECQCFQLVKQDDKADLNRYFLTKSGLFKDCPDMLALPNYTGSSFTLSLAGKMVYGSYHKMNTLKPVEGAENDPEIYKKLQWDNRVVELVEGFLALIQAVAPSDLGYLRQAPEKDYLRPVPRFLFHLLHEDPLIALPEIEDLDSAIKLAAKKAFAILPTGETYFACFSLLKKEALSSLNPLQTRPQFDKTHLDLVNKLVALTGSQYSFASLAYWLDLTYAYALLSEKLILSEKSVALLHSPVDEKTLKDANGGVDETAYLFFQNEGRKEWSILHISPVYFYFEALYSSAHPLEGPKKTNAA
jgi:hypothetical protein